MEISRISRRMRTMELLGSFIPPEERWDPEDDEFHSVVTISLGELLREGVITWEMPEMQWRYYDNEQLSRVTQAIEDRYWDRELGILPVRAWMRRFVGRMNEMMDRLRPAYQKVKDANLMQLSDDFFKGRSVGSAFPATQLKPTTQDYASDASDSETERVIEGNYFQQTQLLKEYIGLDQQLVDYIDVLFSSLVTVNSNAF